MTGRLATTFAFVLVSHFQVRPLAVLEVLTLIVFASLRFFAADDRINVLSFDDLDGDYIARFEFIGL